MVVVRDKLWIWGHEAGSHGYEEWSLPEPSRITQVEGAFYMGIPNIIQVRYGGKPAPPYHQYAIPFRALKNVVWSIVGAGGVTDNSELDAVLKLTETLPNFSGVMMDDFFHHNKEGEPAVLTLQQLESIKKTLTSSGRDLDLWVVLYKTQLEMRVQEHLKICDKVTFWTWESVELKDLEENFSKVEELAPSCGKILGCYMWDYGPKKPVPIDRMEMQCEIGLKWLKERR